MRLLGLRSCYRLDTGARYSGGVEGAVAVRVRHAGTKAGREGYGPRLACKTHEFRMWMRRMGRTAEENDGRDDACAEADTTVLLSILRPQSIACHVRLHQEVSH